MAVCTCCHNQAQERGSDDLPTRFDMIYPLCEECYRVVEQGVTIIGVQNRESEGATRRHNALVGCLFQSEELDQLVKKCDASHGVVLLGYWLISLSAKIQDMPVNELLTWAGNNRPGPVLEGLRKASQPTCVG
ncbi:MAG: hypothetical protein Q7K33_02295 [Candidatus Berkelbacteria bacterium]|nr:hypothetical protein [Candidatus Berkelbacteria bacterium]